MEILDEPAPPPSQPALPDVPRDVLKTPNWSGNGYEYVPVVDGGIGLKQYSKFMHKHLLL